MDTLTAQEIVGCYSRLARPELLSKPEESGSQPAIDDLAYGVLRASVKTVPLFVRGLKGSDEPDQPEEMVGRYAIEDLFCDEACCSLNSVGPPKWRGIFRRIRLYRPREISENLNIEVERLTPTRRP